MSHQTASVRTDLPEWAEFLAEPARYKVAYGGRGASKSWSFARALLIEAMHGSKRILCAREFQVSIRDSVHRLLEDQIGLMGLDDSFEVLGNEIKSTAGSLFLFEGLRYNVSRIRSMEGIDLCWVEEAEKVSDKSWEVLIPTIRNEGSEIWVTLHPDDENDPTYKRFVARPPPDAVVRRVGWEDNPWLPEELRKEKDYLYRVDPDAAEHVWGGEFRLVKSAQVLAGKWRVASVEPGPGWDGPYYGADWGFSADPTVLIKCWIAANVLYIEREAYGLGVEIGDIPALFDKIPGSREHTIRADSSRPEMVKHIAGQGFKIVGASKWPGSVKDGITFLRSFEEIVIDPGCSGIRQEAKLWRYKVDRLTEDVLPILEDGHEHGWDSVRYALQPLIKKQPAWRPV
jgi:phage terminase large subunit